MAERDIVRDIRKYLTSCENSHPATVLFWERLQSGRIHRGGEHIWLCREGTSDFIVVIINKQRNLSFLFLEVKNTGIYEPRDGAQKAFRDKYGNRHIDMIYTVAQSLQDVKDIINKIGINQVEQLEWKP